jgi:hypothetical protein
VKAGWAFRVLVFALAFILEVRVKAAGVQLPDAEEILQEPKTCLMQSIECGMHTKIGEKFEFEMGESTIVMDQMTTIVRVSAEELRLVAGTIWVKTENRVIVRTEFGTSHLQDGEIWVSRTSDRVTVATTRGKADIRPRGSSEKLLVEPGSENFLTKVDENGKAATGVPVAIAFGPHVERWARLFDGKKTEFEKEVGAFHKIWSEASEQAAGIHQELLERKIASVEEERQRKADAKHRAEAYDKSIRDMFRKHVLDVR